MLNWSTSMWKKASKTRNLEYILFSPSCRLSVIGVSHGRKDVIYLQVHVLTNVDKSTCGKFSVLENAG